MPHVIGRVEIATQYTLIILLKDTKEILLISRMKTLVGN